MNKQEIVLVEEILGYTFNDTSLLETALTHKSFVNECMIKNIESYERIEFLGDAILEYLTSEYLYNSYPNKSEGELTKLRASLVCEFTLSKITRSLDIAKYIRFSKGELKSGGINRDSILCDVFESVLGAIYKDGGIVPAKEYVMKFLLTDIENKALYNDCKTKIQEYVQKKGIDNYKYELIGEIGPEHDKSFEVKLVINNKEISRGKGHNKKNAEQEAAYNALNKLGIS